MVNDDYGQFIDLETEETKEQHKHFTHQDQSKENPKLDYGVYITHILSWIAIGYFFYKTIYH
jgi:hypothetical protein